MDSAYWRQYSLAEILSMHGVEFEEYGSNEECIADLSQIQCNCSNCMDCLGLSWKDFL